MSKIINNKNEIDEDKLSYIVDEIKSKLNKASKINSMNSYEIINEEEITKSYLGEVLIDPKDINSEDIINTLISIKDEGLAYSDGSKTINELKEEAYLEIAAFSDFTVDSLTGNFGGEIRLAWYFDGSKVIPVTGGSISGNIMELQKELYLSKELQRDNNFIGPKAIKLINVTISSE